MSHLESVMPPLIKKLLDEAGSIIIEDIVGPTQPADPGEQVIGEVPNYLRGIWEVARVNHALHEELCPVIRSPEFNKLSEGERIRMKQLHDQAVMIKKLAKTVFALSFVELTVDHWDAPTLDIRKGWKIIRSDAKSGSNKSLFDILLGRLEDQAVEEIAKHTATNGKPN